MKTKVLSLNVDKSMSFSRFQSRLVSSLKAYTDDNLVTQHFEDIRESFMALQDALQSDDLIITVVDTRNYLRFKSALIQAFECGAEYNSAVLNKIEKRIELDDKKKKAFAAFPAVATVFVSDDGFYSGFGLDNGSQCILCLPIDNARIDTILREGAIPFLHNVFGSQEQIKTVEESNKVNIKKVEIAVNKILGSKSVVAINGTKNAEVLKSCGDYVKGFNDAFIFTPHVEDKGTVNVTEYTAQLAKVSLDLSSANLGACISDVYTAGDVKYICIAVANDQSAVVRKLYMSDNETEYEFVESAAIELVELVGERAQGARSIGIEITEDTSDENAITEKDKKPAGKKPLAILAVILGLVVALCAVIGIVYKSQGEDGMFANAINSIFNKQEEQTTEASTTEKPTVKPDVNDKETTYKFINNVVGATGDVRVSGALGLDLAYLAAGKIDAVIAPNAMQASIAAGILLVKEVIFVIACFDSSASFLISPATTAKPLPCSPARAASTAALRANMFVCSAISSTTLIVLPICCVCSESSNINSAIIWIFCLKINILSAFAAIASCSFCEKDID